MYRMTIITGTTRPSGNEYLVLIGQESARLQNSLGHLTFAGEPLISIASAKHFKMTQQKLSLTHWPSPLAAISAQSIHLVTKKFRVLVHEYYVLVHLGGLLAIGPILFCLFDPFMAKLSFHLAKSKTRYNHTTS